MRQLERINLCREYYANPLHEKYEAEKQNLEKSVGRNSPLVILMKGISAILIIMVFVFGYWFFKSEYLDEPTPFTDVFTLIFWGIVNLVACLIMSFATWCVRDEIAKKSTGYTNLIYKYGELGLNIMPFDEVCKHCPEIDSYGASCGVTGRRLSIEEKEWCQKNCRDCRKLRDAVFSGLFDD